MRSATRAFAPPALAMPDRSPFTSAMNTGTPIDENACARDCSVTVLPVPVAPVINPCRFASGAGTLEGVTYEEIRYEGYGIGGAAIIVDCMTDNRTRTVAEVRHAFAKNGGNLGTDGSVAFLFKHCGQFLFAPGLSEDKVM